MGVLDSQTVRRRTNRRMRRRGGGEARGGGSSRAERAAVRDVARQAAREERTLRRDPRDLLAEGRSTSTSGGPGSWIRAEALLEHASGALGACGRLLLSALRWGGQLTLAALGALAAALVALATATLRLFGRGSVAARASLRRARPRVRAGVQRSAKLGQQGVRRSAELGQRGVVASARIGKRLATETQVRLRDQASYMEDGFPDVRQGVAEVRGGARWLRQRLVMRLRRIDWRGQLGWPGFRAVARSVGTGLAIGVTALVAIAIGLYGPAAVRDTDALAVEQVAVRGHQRVPAEAIRAAAAVEYGTNLTTLDLERIADDVRALPWVESVSLRRRYPDRLTIDVVERQPALLLVDGALWFVDHGGEVFKPVEAGEWLDLPVVTGMGMDARVPEPDVARQRLRRVVALVEAFEGSSQLGVEDIGEIRVLPDGGFEVLTTSDGVALELGEEAFAEGLRRLDTLLADELLALDGVTDVNLSLRNQVVAVKKVER